MGHAPENTIASFQKALDLGCDEIETDVWLTDDGRLVISHDRPQQNGGLSLDEVLDFCGDRMAVNVELKAEASEARARETGGRVATHLARRAGVEAYVSSFWWPALEGARAAAPGIRRAFLFEASPDRRALLESASRSELWALHPNRVFVTPELVQAAQDAGLRVQAWTVNDPREIAEMRSWSVDGIMSDFPERVPKD
jgi:glycerophosphoryl diester phosphodiesterase